MLEELRLSGLGVIDDALLEFDPGFTVVTGETGAGKTMVVSGLALLLGGRGDPGAVRPGHGQAVVEGRVRVADESPVATRATDAGAVLDDGALIIARTVSADARSRAHLGGRAVPIGLLGELAADLVAVHGQSDQLRLLRPAAQRDALDRFAGEAATSLLASYSADLARLRDVLSTLEEIATRGRERAQEADLLRLGLQEVATIDPQPGEDEQLAAEAERLTHADALRRAADEAHAALAGDAATPAGEATDALTLVGVARRAVELVTGHDSSLDELGRRLADAGYLLADAAADLASYAASVEADPARLEAVQQRRAQLTSLTRKYAPTVEQVLAWAATAQERLAGLDHDDLRIEELTAERDGLLARLADTATALSRVRQEAAERFERAVSDELRALAMPHARVEVRVSQHDDPAGLSCQGRRVAFGPAGVDEVELLLAPHPGAPARPLQRGASGGELSRVMLAVEVVFAGADPVPTFVFDEVDAGVGGRAAVEIGRRLAILARSAQVIAVTHLPQVAAFADRHLVVTKTSDGAVTRSGVRPVDGEDRLRELSRMLAGLEDSERARGHAEELLEAAVAAKQLTG